MRSARGYLDSLIRSARPSAPATSAVRSTHVPAWGPTRLPDSADEAAPVDPPRPAPRAPTSPRPAPSSTARITTVRQAPDAAARPPVARTEPPRPLPTRSSVPHAPTSEPATPTSRADVERAVVERRTEPSRPAEPAPSAVARLVPAPPAEVESHEIVMAPSAGPPVGSEAALERLERLVRRFSSALPADTLPPAPSARREEEPYSPPGRDRRAEAHPVAIPVAAPAPPRRGEPPRVEIGSIEVFVTQPPSSASVAASAPPARVPPATPAASERLSRLLHPYGFGQG